MELHHQLSDAEFEQQFASASLDPSFFSHEAHLRLAWIHIRQYGVDQACESICAQIQRFDSIYGDGTKFNKTVTIACVRAVYHFMLKTSADNFQEFIQEFPRLKYHLKDLIDCHYSFDIFRSTVAKTKYLAPDLLPFD